MCEPPVFFINKRKKKANSFDDLSFRHHQLTIFMRLSRNQRTFKNGLGDLLFVYLFILCFYYSREVWDVLRWFLVNYCEKKILLNIVFL